MIHCDVNIINVISELRHYTSFNFNPLKPEFNIVIFIHYKPRIADAILHL